MCVSGGGRARYGEGEEVVEEIESSGVGVGDFCPPPPPSPPQYALDHLKTRQHPRNNVFLKARLGVAQTRKKTQFRDLCFRPNSRRTYHQFVLVRWAFSTLFCASGKANTPEKRFHEIDRALRNGDGA
jgi:hypothetical protein